MSEEKKVLQQIMEDPSTKGEESQSEKLKKFNDDAEVIVDTRKKLENLQSDLTSDKKTIDDTVETLRKDNKEIPQFKQRHYDRSILKRKPKKSYKQILSFFKIRTLFFKKYGSENKISYRFFNFLIDKEIFHPGISVYSFVKDLIVTQQQLRPYFRKMYSGGWLNDSGEDVLGPREFNMIGEMERAVGDDSLINFLIYSKQPTIAIKKISSFLGYYLSITRDDSAKSILISATEKSLGRILFPDQSEIKKVESIMKRIKEFISIEVDEDFLIPLFESVYLEPFTNKKIRESIVLEKIPGSYYKASGNLNQLMNSKRNNLSEAIQNKAKNIEEELAFIRDLKELVNKNVIVKSKKIPFLEYMLLNYHENDIESFNLRRKNIAAFIHDLCDFFYKTYELLFLEGINVKIDQTIKNIKIFETLVFENEINAVKTLNRNLSEYINSGYTFDLLSQTKDKNKNIVFLNILDKLNDAFYAIGEKLITIISGHEKKFTSKKHFSTKTIILKEYNESIIPYHDTKIMNINPSMNKGYSLADKSVMSALKEIMIFCLCISYRFENSHRDFSKTWRKESISDKIAKEKFLIEKLQKLQSGENI